MTPIREAAAAVQEMVDRAAAVLTENCIFKPGDSCGQAPSTSVRIAAAALALGHAQAKLELLRNLLRPWEMIEPCPVTSPVLHPGDLLKGGYVNSVFVTPSGMPTSAYPSPSMSNSAVVPAASSSPLRVWNAP